MILMFIYMILVCIIVYTLYLLRAAQTKLRLLEEKQKRINALHRHPVIEQRYSLDDKVIVDEEFKDLFSSYRYVDLQHILVSIAEYHNLKGIK